eukprot:TRINITY_DN1583_c0_g2_i1.p1 TRINITY_DN1583_c0_g2~~TRINITY_DN1583_c0_g2_i1.p1  ORF type:complete len:533 (-),score=118.88 TRINITY_DN1583_c0_g2_i1:62-1516(-)
MSPFAEPFDNFLLMSAISSQNSTPTFMDLETQYPAYQQQYMDNSNQTTSGLGMAINSNMHSYNPSYTNTPPTGHNYGLPATNNSMHMRNQSSLSLEQNIAQPVPPNTYGMGAFPRERKPYEYAGQNVPRSDGIKIFSSTAQTSRDDSKKRQRTVKKARLTTTSSRTTKNEEDAAQAEKIKRRRESQNRASRNYRLRRKEYIKDIEKKLSELQLENENLRKETSLLQQENDALRNGNVDAKPAPLLRSYSTELRNNDKEIDKIVNQLGAATSVAENELNIRNILSTFHKHFKERQELYMKEVQQFVNPKMQERLVRLEGVRPNNLAKNPRQDLSDWLIYMSRNGVSEEQLIALRELKIQHSVAMDKILQERSNINSEIRYYYQQKLRGENTATGVGDAETSDKLDQGAIEILSQKLDSLKDNLSTEVEAVNKTMDDLGQILTPYQEAMLTLKHYEYYKDKLSTFQMLNNVWNAIAEPGENGDVSE